MTYEIEIGRGKRGRRAYSLDDIAIVPNRRTRDPKDVSVSWQIDAYQFSMPVIAAPMDSAMSPQTAIALGRLGGLGVLDLEGLWTRYEDPQPVLDEIGTGCIVLSPLAQGLLTDRYLDGTVPAGSRAATSRFLSSDRIDEKYLERARGLNAIAEGRGQTLAQLALTWVLRVPTVTSAIIGASSVAQLEQNVAALEPCPLTESETAAIEEFAVHGTSLT